MTNEHLNTVLAQKVMGWNLGPDRFMMGDRRWMPRWRFQPTENLMDAFRLLESSTPDEYTMSGGNEVGFLVRVRIGSVIGEARGQSKPRTIAYAVARAVGITVPVTGEEESLNGN